MADISKWFKTENLSQAQIDTFFGFPVAVAQQLNEPSVLLSYDETKDSEVIQIMATMNYFPVPVEPAVFGNGATYEEEMEMMQHTSAAPLYQTRVSLASGVVQAGKYRVGWSFEWTATDDFLARVRVDETVVAECNQYVRSNRQTRNPVTGFVHVDVTTGTHDVVLEFASLSDGKMVGMGNARLEFWRVG